MSKHLFFDEREYLRDEAIIEGERWQRELIEQQMLEEREKSFKARGIRIFRSTDRWKNRKGKKHIFFPYYPKEALPF